MNVKSIHVRLTDNRPRLKDAIWKNGIHPKQRLREGIISWNADGWRNHAKPTLEFIGQIKTFEIQAVIVVDRSF